MLTASRLVFAAGVAVLTVWSRTSLLAILASGALIGLIELTDFLDGHLARRHELVSDFGKMFDPYADSVSRVIVYWSLAVIGRCPPVVPLVLALAYLLLVLMGLHCRRVLSEGHWAAGVSRKRNQASVYFVGRSMQSRHRFRLRTLPRLQARQLALLAEEDWG